MAYARKNITTEEEKLIMREFADKAKLLRDIRNSHKGN